MLVYQNAVGMSIVFYSFLDNFSEKFFLHYIDKKMKKYWWYQAGHQDGRQGTRTLQAKLTIIVPKFSTINIIFNIYKILNIFIV